MLKTQWKKQAKEILALAQENGVKSNFLFSTTFDRYMTQLELLERLKERLKEEDLIIEKEYLKGSRNSYANPALSDFNKTTDSANKSASTLIRIINSFITGDDSTEADPLIKILNGNGEDDDDSL